MNTAVNEKLDPMPIGTLAMWLFLASETMFFVGMLGALIVLDSAGGQHALFVRSSQSLSNIIGLVSVVLLIASSLSLRRFLSIAMLTAVLFLSLQGLQWRVLLRQGNGLSQNNFFGFYFLLSSVHCLHVIIGIAAIVCLKGKRPEPVQIYWHFVNAVGVVTLAAIYFV